MLVEVVNAALNAVEDVTGIVIEFDHGELGGRNGCQTVQQRYLTLPGRSLVECGRIEGRSVAEGVRPEDRPSHAEP